VDEPHVHYGITPRDVLRTLSRALTELGVPHPLHVHASNLGVPGNIGLDDRHYGRRRRPAHSSDPYPVS